MLYISDMVSGALLAAVVDRAKKLAIKDFLATGVRGIAVEHVRAAVREETAAGEDMATAVNPEEWARVNARGRSERVVDVRPLFGGVPDREGARGVRADPYGRDANGDRGIREFDPADSKGLI